MSQILEWTPEMANIFDGSRDEEYELHGRILVKSLSGYLQNPENGINPKHVTADNFEKMEDFYLKLCQIGNLRKADSKTDMYLLFSHALFIADNGWDSFKHMLIARKRIRNER